MRQADCWTLPQLSRRTLARSSSEAFLLSLVQRSFLKLWAVPNSFYAQNKELSDLIIPFGDDVIIISDKACRFDFEKPSKLAWGRWYRSAIKDSVRQLKTAMQRIERAPESVFTDSRASSPLPWPIAQNGKPRFHLVAVARPHPSPDSELPDWPGLRYQFPISDEPFRVGKVDVAGLQVHIFDGPTIDLILDRLDTAPDFIAYLTERAERLAEANEYDFSERDLLAASLIGWDKAPTRLPSAPPLEAVTDGLWEMYETGGIARFRHLADSKSRIIDAFVEHTHDEFVAGRVLYDQPTYVQHEHAMRLLAAESRFARRVVATELHDILDEPDQSTFWASTVRSPTNPSLRYVWLIYPTRPEEMSEAEFDRFAEQHLKQHVLVAQGLFEETLVLGICLPNRTAEDTATVTVLHDGSKWTETDRQEALKLQEHGVFSQLEAIERAHIP